MWIIVGFAVAILVYPFFKLVFEFAWFLAKAIIIAFVIYVIATMIQDGMPDPARAFFLGL